MHDPLTVAFDIIRPWPRRDHMRLRPGGRRWEIRHHHEHHQPYCGENDCTGNPFPWWKLRSYSRFWMLAGRRFYWPALVTVWHREPHGRDSGEVCQHLRRWQDADGKWHSKVLNGWRFHVWHWRIQFPPLQALRRSLLTRCTWCGQRSRKGDWVNISHSWDGPRGHWWRGEPGLFHQDCSAIEHAHRMCLCPEPKFARPDSGYGDCLRCGRFRAWRSEPDEADRLLAAIPLGGRIAPAIRPAIEAAWAARRRQKEAAEAAESGNR